MSLKEKLIRLRWLTHRRGSSNDLKVGHENNVSDRRKTLYRIALVLILILSIALLFPVRETYLPLDVPTVGEISSQDIVAPFDFTVSRSAEELERDRQLVLANAKPVLVVDTAVTAAIRRQTDVFFTAVGEVVFSRFASEEKAAGLRARFPFLSDSLARFLRDNAFDRVRQLVIRCLDTLLADGVIAETTHLPLGASGLVVIRGPDSHRLAMRDKLMTLLAARKAAESLTEALAGGQSDTTIYASRIVAEFLRPNLVFDKKQTDSLRQAELGAIPYTKGTVAKGERIVSAGERLTESQRDKLISLAQARHRYQFQQNLWGYWLPRLGRLLFIVLPVVFFFSYLRYFRNQVYSSDSGFLLLAVLIVGEMLLLRGVISQHYLSPYITPLTIASMLATILFDEEVGIMMTITLGMLAGTLLDFKLDIAYVTIVAGTVACFAVRRVRHRHDFYRPIIYLCLTYGILVYVIESLRLAGPSQVMPRVGMAFANGFLSPILTIGLLPLFETVFGMTTDITLLELSDLNRPLLKRLAIDAPGTYHHSIMIGTLAEDAAEAIGANSLLARVGSYYHDIGKILKPEYFVENQQGADNKHEKLAPTMSALILEAHVKEGVDLAIRHGLPKSIIEFITGHHGTGVMTYFYDKARQEIGDQADIRDFRYPGPNPRSKEVAIVMLADSVEAASRTLDDPKPARIRSLVHRIFLEKLDSGLLEHSQLTLSDIKKIEDSFVRVLTAFFHRRVKYPEKREIPV